MAISKANRANVQKLAVSYEAYHEVMRGLVPGRGSAKQYASIAYWAKSLQEAQNATGIVLHASIDDSVALYSRRCAEEESRESENKQFTLSLT